MSYNFETMFKATPTSIRKKQDIRNAERGKKILDYAINIYNCEFSKNFQKQLEHGFYGHYEMPHCRVIDGLVKEWMIWEPYVSSDSYSKFIEDGLNSIIKIGATATFRSSNLNGYIGRKAKVIKELPLILSTSISWNGTLRVNGKVV